MKVAPLSVWRSNSSYVGDEGDDDGRLLILTTTTYDLNWNRTYKDVVYRNGERGADQHGQRLERPGDDRARRRHPFGAASRRTNSPSDYPPARTIHMG